MIFAAIAFAVGISSSFATTLFTRPMRYASFASTLSQVKIISKGSYAVSVAKAAINNGYDMDIKNAVEMEANLFGVVNDTHDKKEGMGAFLEKRAATLTDF
jgi:enoyl-CoA hydratase/carnithine racemase